MAAFYTDKPSSQLRFGDVLTGFQNAELRIDAPETTATSIDIHIHVTQPKYFVVMTPCCSIDSKSISLAPLEELRPVFVLLPQLWDDLLSVNFPMPAERAVPPTAWEHFDEVKKSETIARGTVYVLVDIFIYEPHALFATYTLKKGKDSHDFQHRFVDFRKIYRVDCSKIERNQDAPPGTKLLQLTEGVRAQLRDKMAYFFGRPPEEDLVQLRTALVKPL